LVNNKGREPYYRKNCRECEKKYQVVRRHKIDTTIGFSSSVGEKECTKCKIAKPLTEFSLNNSCPGSYTWVTPMKYEKE